MAKKPKTFEAAAAGAAASEEKLRRRRDAQRLADRAVRLLGEGRAAEAADLSREALGIYPDCVDARLIVADADIDDLPGFLEALGQACDAGVRDLGEDFLERNRGKAGSIPEARPYLRALGLLAETLREHPRKPMRLEAIDVYLRLLELDGEDRLEVRGALASLLLSLRHPKSASEILSTFSHDKSPVMQWLRAFARFGLDDREGAERLARDADSRNGRIMPYALGLERMPKDPPVLRGGGRPHEAEALRAAELLRLVIRSSRPLRAWLIERFGKDVDSSPRPGARPQERKMPKEVERAPESSHESSHKSNHESSHESIDAEIDALPPLTPEDRAAAQKLADEAWTLAEAGESGKAIGLCKQAMGRNMDCVSAMHLLAEIGDFDRKDRLKMLQLARSAGMRELGSRLFSENVGRFWELPETQPYMRACCRYGHLLRDGRSRADREKAIELYTHLLALRHRDELGCRASLVSLLLSFGRLDEAREVLDRYPADRLLSVRWLGIVARFAAGERDDAARLARVAEADNRHVLHFVLGLEPMPRDAPRAVVREPHSTSEAAEVAELLRPVLRPPAASRTLSAEAAFEGLFQWLLVQFVEAGGAPGSRDQEARATFAVLRLPTNVRIPDEVMKAFLGKSRSGRSRSGKSKDRATHGAMPAAAARPLWQPAPAVPRGTSDRQRFDAQQHAYTAMELLGSGRRSEALAHCRKAIAIHPDCIDAMLMAAELEIGDPETYLEALAEICNAGVRDLGEKFIKRHAGDFWGLLETRPYMRALAAFAGALQADVRRDRREQALEVYEEMLRLNPGDNQGIREPLVSLLLALGMPDRAERWLEAYADDAMLAMEWLRAIALFARGAERERDAREAARRAARANVHVLPYAIGVRPMPRRRSGEYVLGTDSPSEALHVADMILPIVREMKGLKDWLREIHRENRRADAQLKLHPAEDEEDGETPEAARRG